MCIKKLSSFSLFQSAQEEDTASSFDEKRKQLIPRTARCYRFNDSDDEACENETMVSLMENNF